MYERMNALVGIGNVTISLVAIVTETRMQMNKHDSSLIAILNVSFDTRNFTHLSESMSEHTCGFVLKLNFFVSCVAMLR